MSEVEYERLLRRSETFGTAGRMVGSLAKPAAAVGMLADKMALKAVLGGDLSDALAVLDCVDGNK